MEASYLMKKFWTGALVGNLVTVAAIAGAVFGYKKKVIEPIEAKERFIDDQRKKANRKRTFH